jgi:hypothetical protein
VEKEHPSGYGGVLTYWRRLQLGSRAEVKQLANNAAIGQQMFVNG